jgi:hypothetical protein
MSEDKAVCRVCGKEYVVSKDPLLGSRMRHGVCSSECARLYFANPYDYQDDGPKVHENYLKWRGLDFLIKRRKLK